MVEYAKKAELEGYTRVTKTHLGISADSDFNDLLDVVLGMSRQKIDNFTNRDFQEHDYTTTPYVLSVGPTPLNMLPLPGPIIGSSQNPCDDITKVEIRGGKGDTWTELDSENYTVILADMNKAPARRFADEVLLVKTGLGTNESDRKEYYNPYSASARAWKATWHEGYENVRVEFSWGFETVPETIRDICVQLSDFMLQELVNKYHAGVKIMGSTSSRTLLSVYALPAPLKLELMPFLSLQDRISVVGV